MTLFSDIAVEEKPAPRGRVDILLVDDHPANLLALEAILQDLGQNLVKAYSGEEALRRLLVSDFAVILLDVQMSEMDGFETARLIRGREKSRQTPIIFLTAYEHNRPREEEAYALGAVDYLVKPIVPSVLKAKVAGFIELFQKTEKVKEQGEQLRQMDRREFNLKLAEENARLRKAEEKLKEEARRKDEFLAMLGHELRNPLAPVRNALQIMKMPGAAETEVEAARDMMDRQIQHLVRLVDDLLDVSRIMWNRIELHSERVDLGTVFGRAVETAQAAIDAQGHRLHVSMPPEPLALQADPVRLAQVISNLLMNAAKYTDKAGDIWLSAERDDHEAVIRVRDTGIGIDEALLPQVFDLFVQSNRSLARSQGGLGIGLTLVKRLVEMHGGTVCATSAGPGQGSEFTIRLPLLGSTQGNETPAPASDSSAGTRQRRILIVDDNTDAATSAAVLLRLIGHKVETAGDGAAALELAARFRPEIALLDIGLPGMSGYELARALRAQHENQGAILIAVTGYGQEEDRRMSYDAGFDRHLVKPVDPAALIQLVSEV